MPADSAPTGSSTRAIRELAGWGSTAPTVAEVAPLLDEERLRIDLKGSGRRGLIARGMGRSYGDAAQNSGGLVIDGTSSSGLMELDIATGEVTALAGTTVDELIRWLVPLGWFVPVTPGTRSVTVGGAIAADIHGKNHHRKGSWCRHVGSLRLMIGDGTVLDVSQLNDPELFWATAGGMGLTGVILDATFRMTPIETSWITVDTDRAADLDAVMALMADGDADYDYSVAWIDLVASGAGMGRSVLTRGRFARRDELGRRESKRPLEFTDRELFGAPPLPNGLLNPLTVRAFNEAWYRKSPRLRRDELQTIGQFFHPLDMIRDWNRMYGPRGCVQWQCVVPFERGDVIEAAVRRISATNMSSFLAVLKLFGPGDAAPLSFPTEGWTLALDIPVTPGLERTLDDLDEQVVEAGGRLYLAKDSRMRPELLPRMYPRVDEWRVVRDRVDPEGRFRSDLGRRLGLCN